jgi:hypothetical protein
LYAVQAVFSELPCACWSGGRYEALAADVRPEQVLDAIVDAIPQPDVELGSGRAIG